MFLVVSAVNQNCSTTTLNNAPTHKHSHLRFIRNVLSIANSKLGITIMVVSHRHTVYMSTPSHLIRIEWTHYGECVCKHTG